MRWAVGLLLCAAAPDTCAHTEVARLASPAGWVALVDEAACGDGALGAAIVETVRLLPPHGPAADVLDVQTGGRPEERPLLRWDGQVLLVTLPDRRFMTVLQERVGPVRIELRDAPP